MWRTFCSGTSLSSEKGCVDKVVTSVFCALSHLSTSEGRLNYAGCWQCVACVYLLYSELWLEEGSISVLELCSYLCFSSWGVPSMQTMPLATPHLLLGPSEGNQTQTCICACTLLLSGSLTVPVSQGRVLICFEACLPFPFWGESLFSLCGSWPSRV